MHLGQMTLTMVRYLLRHFVVAPLNRERVARVNHRKNVPRCNHLDIGALRLPTLSRNQAGDVYDAELRKATGMQRGGCRRGCAFFSVYGSTLPRSSVTPLDSVAK